MLETFAKWPIKNYCWQNNCNSSVKKQYIPHIAQKFFVSLYLLHVLQRCTYQVFPTHIPCQELMSFMTPNVHGHGLVKCNISHSHSLLTASLPNKAPYCQIVPLGYYLGPTLFLRKFRFPNSRPGALIGKPRWYLSQGTKIQNKLTLGGSDTGVQKFQIFPVISTTVTGLSLLRCLIIRSAAYYDTRSISQLLQSIRNLYWIFR